MVGVSGVCIHSVGIQSGARVGCLKYCASHTHSSLNLPITVQNKRADEPAICSALLCFATIFKDRHDCRVRCSVPLVLAWEAEAGESLEFEERWSTHD